LRCIQKGSDNMFSKVFLLCLGFLAYAAAEVADAPAPETNDEPAVNPEEGPAEQPEAKNDEEEQFPGEVKDEDLELEADESSDLAETGLGIEDEGDALLNDMKEDDSEIDEDADPAKKKGAKKAKKMKKKKMTPCYVWKALCKRVNKCKKCIYKRVFLHPVFCWARTVRCVFGCFPRHVKTVRRRCLRVRNRRRRMICLKNIKKITSQQCHRWCMGH